MPGGPRARALRAPGEAPRHGAGASDGFLPFTLRFLHLYPLSGASCCRVVDEGQVEFLPRQHFDWR